MRKILLREGVPPKDAVRSPHLGTWWGEKVLNLTLGPLIKGYRVVIHSWIPNSFPDYTPGRIGPFKLFNKGVRPDGWPGSTPIRPDIGGYILSNYSHLPSLSKEEWEEVLYHSSTLLDLHFSATKKVAEKLGSKVILLDEVLPLAECQGYPKKYYTQIVTPWGTIKKFEGSEEFTMLVPGTPLILYLLGSKGIFSHIAGLAMWDYLQTRLDYHRDLEELQREFGPLEEDIVVFPPIRISLEGFSFQGPPTQYTLRRLG